MFSVKLTQDFKPIAERVTNGEKVLISCPKNENLVNLVVITEEEYNKLEEMRKEQKRKSGERLLKVIEETQRQSVINGTDNMTLEEINDIIAEVRQGTQR